MKLSEEMKKHLSLVLTKGRKCSVDGCNEPHHGLGYCKNHYQKHRRKNDTKYRDRINKNQLQKYYDNHEERKKRKRIIGKSERAELYKKLGAKCVSCAEKLNSDLARSNLQIHHRFYDTKDEEVKMMHKGQLGSRHIGELKRMIKNGINPKKKFVLLCQQCHEIETASHQDPKKAFDMFAWLYGEGLFDKVLKADPKLKKLTDFMKK